MCILCSKKLTHPSQTLFNFNVLTTAKRCPVFKGSDSTHLIKVLEHLVGYFSEEISDVGRWSCIEVQSRLYFYSLPHPIYWKESTWRGERWGWGDDEAASFVC